MPQYKFSDDQLLYLYLSTFAPLQLIQLQPRLCVLFDLRQIRIHDGWGLHTRQPAIARPFCGSPLR